MPDLSTQLRDYFDAVIERTTADDVLARSAFDREPELEAPRRSMRRRPALQAALAVGFGFSLTMLVTGGLLAVALVAGEIADGGADVGSGVGVPAGGGGSATWIVAAALLITGAGAAAAVAVRRRTGHMPITEESDMKTIETDSGTGELDSRVRTLERRNRWLVAGVVVLLVATAALGGILLFAGDDSEFAFAPGVDAATVDEINTLLDANLEGWSEGDGEAVMATMAEDGFHISRGTVGFAFSGDRLQSFSSQFAFNSWERLRSPIIEGDGNGYYVADLTRIFLDSADPSEAAPLLIITRVVPEGGELRIAEQVVYEDIDWSMYGLDN